MNTVQENELGSKACSEPEHDSFCLWVFSPDGIRIWGSNSC